MTWYIGSAWKGARHKMARLTRPHPGAPPDQVEVVPITLDVMDGARPLLSVLCLANGQVATWPFIENLRGLDTEDVERLAASVRATLMLLVRQQG
jgi:hypothetical protein